MSIQIDKWGKVVIEEDRILVSGFESSWVGSEEPNEEHPAMEFFPEIVLQEARKRIDKELEVFERWQEAIDLLRSS